MAATSVPSETTEKKEKRRSFFMDILIRLIKEKPLATFGLAIVIILLFTAITCQWIAPYGMNEIHLRDRLQPPSTKYWMGTDDLGRDLMSRILYGARISVIVGFSGALIDVIVAILLGATSGFFGGKVDAIVMRFVDAIMCFPMLFFALTAMAILGPGIIQVIVVLGVFDGIRAARVVRSAVISVKSNVYVEAAKAIGATGSRVLMQHVLPNIMAAVIVLFSVAVGGIVLSESTLSFLGFGIPPPTPTWGGMISGPGREYLVDAPWMAIWPGLALSLAVYCINMLGDGLRDLLDPRLRGGLGRYGGSKKAKKAKAKIQEPGMTSSTSASNEPAS